MRITRCFRCGGSDIHKGNLPISEFPHIYELTWKSDSPDFVEDTEIIGILCKSCGHIELVAARTLIGEKVQRKCPHCQAQYAYRIPSDTYEKIVECQNCSKKFAIKIDNVLDEIEKEFED